MEFAGPEEEEHEPINTHLRAARELADYRIESEGKVIGVVYDLMLDRESWTIRYVVTSSQNRRGSYSLIPFQMIKKISWPQKQIRVSITKEALAKSPQYDPSKPVTQELEDEIYNYFDQVEYEM
jgi:sporulation protein YlmC with PRC-barrel domain